LNNQRKKEVFDYKITIPNVHSTRNKSDVNDWYCKHSWWTMDRMKYYHFGPQQNRKFNFKSTCNDVHSIIVLVSQTNLSNNIILVTDD